MTFRGRIPLAMITVAVLLARADRAHAGKDVGLHDISSLGQAARSGTFPNGQTAISLTTTVCNLGNQDVPWQAPMAEDHPFIGYAIYRLKDDRLEQIGRSWAKHTFFVVGHSDCSTCNNSGGSILPVSCSDTYSNTANANQFYLGPREEIDPYSGIWHACGSYFDGTPQDCLRNNPGTLGALEHRCVLADGDLGDGSAVYYYEAMYVVRDDVDTSNNIGSRFFTSSWQGSSWFFATPFTDNALVLGPVVATRWLTGGGNQLLSTAADPGLVYVASKATSLGGGQYHYEYAVFNYNYTRRLRTFVVPLPAGATASNVGFHDGDSDAGNDWPAAADSTCQTITWSTDTVDVNPAANALQWGYQFNFRFDADAAPATASAGMDAFLSGAGSNRLTVAAIAPAIPACLKGDVNGDGLVNGLDAQAFADLIANPGCATSRAFCAADVHSGDLLLDSQDAIGLANLLLTN